MALAQLATAGGSIYLDTLAAKKERAGTVAGVKQQIETEKLGQEFQQEQFEAGLERQQPFLEAGQEASPLLTMAIRNELETSNLPASEIQKSLVAAGVPDAPEFVTERVGAGIEATEAENQKSRLLDLVKIGLGAAGSVGGQRTNIALSGAQSAGRIGNIGAEGLQSAATQRQNIATTAIDRLSGLPAFLATQKRRQGGQPLQSGFAQTNTGQFVPVA